MKKFVSILALLLACLALFSACGTEGSDVPAGMKSVDCEGLPYKTYLPAQWQTKRVGTMLEAMVSASTPVAITVRHFEVEETDVQAYWQKTDAELTASLLGYKIEEAPTAYTVCGAEGITVSYSGIKGEAKYRFMQAMSISDGTLYLVTYSAQTNVKTGTDLYGKYLDDAYRVIDEMTPVEETDAPSEIPTEIPTDENGMLILDTETEGWNVSVSAPFGWIDESYGTFAFARDPESGMSFSLTLENTDDVSFVDYWRNTVKSIKTLYPESEFEYKEDGETAGRELVFEDTELAGMRAERVDYILVTSEKRYASVKVVVLEKYPLYVLTLMCPLAEGEDEAATIAKFEETVSAVMASIVIKD